jgi:hypothetical protein
MRTIYLISFLLNLASIQSAFASPPSIQLKAYMLEKSSFATCRLMRKEISTSDSRAYMERILASAIRNYDLSKDDVRDLNAWTEETAMMKAAAKLAKVRFKHGRGPSKCSMEGDNNWLPYVQKLARQS